MSRSSVSREDVSLTMHVGSRLPLFFSAIGRAILVGHDRRGPRRGFELARPRILQGERPGEASLAPGAGRNIEAAGFAPATGTGAGREWHCRASLFAERARVYGLNVGGPSFHVKTKQLETIYAPLLIAAAKRFACGPEARQVQSGQDARSGITRHFCET